MKKYFTKQALLGYLYNVVSGRLLGFVVGSWATGILSKFFETRSIHNLWGFRSNKVLLNKDTYENLEWVVSIVIGYFVFEIFEKVIKEKITAHWPAYYKKSIDYMEEKGYAEKMRQIKENTMVIARSTAEDGKKKAKEIYSRFTQKD